MPHHCCSGGKHWLTEVPLQHLQNLDGRHAGAAQENRLGFWIVHGAAKLVGALGRLGVDVCDILEAFVADDLESTVLRVRLAFERDLFAVRRAERETLYPKRIERRGHAARLVQVRRPIAAASAAPQPLPHFDELERLSQLRGQCSPKQQLLLPAMPADGNERRLPIAINLSRAGEWLRRSCLRDE